MNDKSHYRFTPLVLAVPLYFVLLLWIVYWFEVRFGHNFNTYGIYPRTWKGLRGILLSPFIHGDIKHLYQNSIPLFVLFLSLLYFYRSIAFRVFLYGTLLTGFRVFLYGTLLTGLLTWVIARRSFHIGASGIIYFLFSFILFSGIIRRNYRLIALSLTIIFLYGSMVWYVLPVKAGISWEGHLSGFIMGLLFAFYYREHGPQRIRYRWEEEDYQPDAFDLSFDEEGNFNPKPDRGEGPVKDVSQEDASR